MINCKNAKPYSEHAVECLIQVYRFPSPGTCGQCAKREPRDGSEPVYKKPTPIPIDDSCAHRGEAIDERQCPSCSGTVMVKIFKCEILVTCSIAKKIEGIAVCRECKFKHNFTVINKDGVDPT